VVERVEEYEQLPSERYQGYHNGLSKVNFGLEGFLFGGISPPNKKILLCVLGVSAVRDLFWRRFTPLEIPAGHYF